MKVEIVRIKNPSDEELTTYPFKVDDKNRVIAEVSFDAGLQIKIDDEIVIIPKNVLFGLLSDY